MAGRSLALGYLRSLSLHIQEERVAKALVQVDPTNSGLRWAALLKEENAMYQVLTIFAIVMNIIIWLIGDL